MAVTNKTGSRSQKNNKWIAKAGIVAVAIVIVGGSFALASGIGAPNGTSILAAVISAFSGKPTIVVARSKTSPSGSVTAYQFQNLATFDMSVKNVKWEGLTQQIVVSVQRSGMQMATTKVPTSATGTPTGIPYPTLQAHYTYCIPAGITYGYGYKGGSCGTINLTPATVALNGSTYQYRFGASLPIYPQQSYGAFIVTGVPGSPSTAKAPGKITVSVSSVEAYGDQCTTTKYLETNGSYGYKQTCANAAATIDLSKATGNTLNVIPPTTTLPLTATTTGIH